MTRFLTGAVCAAALFAAPAFSQAINGGDVTLGYATIGGDDATLSATGLAGSVEYGFSRDWAVQGDLTIAEYDGGDLKSLGVHGIYHLSDTMSVGGFVALDDDTGINSNWLGVEAGREFGNADVEGYLSFGEIGGDKVIQFGAEGGLHISQRLELELSMDIVSDDFATFTRYELEGNFDVTDTLSLDLGVGTSGAQIGSLTGDETFVGLGVTYNIGGADRGATFERRGIGANLFGF